jgi:hypothetical protein
VIGSCDIQVAIDVFAFELHIHRPGSKVRLSSDDMGNDTGTKASRRRFIPEWRGVVKGRILEHHLLAANLDGLAPVFHIL